MPLQERDCLLCKNKFTSYSHVCDSCIVDNYFISCYELRKYNFTPTEIKQLPIYYLHSKLYNEYADRRNSYFYGNHYLQEDIDKFTKTNVKYIERMQMLDAKKSFQEKKTAEKKEEHEYLKTQRELFLVAVFKKAGYGGSLYKYSKDNIISSFLTNGYTGGRNSYELETYIYNLVDNMPDTYYDTKNYDNMIKEQQERIKMITSILNVSHDKLSKNNDYMQYVKQGLKWIRRIDGIETLDDFVVYLMLKYVNESDMESNNSYDSDDSFD